MVLAFIGYHHFEALWLSLLLCTYKYHSLCQALRCIGDLIAGNPKNLDVIARKVLGEGPQELALNSILRILLRTSSVQEFLAADYVFKSFCEVNNVFFLHLCFQLMPPSYCISLNFN